MEKTRFTLSIDNLTLIGLKRESLDLNISTSDYINSMILIGQAFKSALEQKDSIDSICNYVEGYIFQNSIAQEIIQNELDKFK
ncbi:MAG: hypothetical protein PHI05_05115 [Bacilli bacterium]|nr:hypothetical protein [Bacilli bacterium]